MKPVLNETGNFQRDCYYGVIVGYGKTWVAGRVPAFLCLALHGSKLRVFISLPVLLMRIGALTH